jgi:transcriptional regulator with XRE-family HTH domain
MAKRIVAADGPDPIDAHVGARLRARRILLGLSQSALAAKLGVTFQQVQKYERGANRLSASQLWRAAEALQVELSFFFAGLRDGTAGDLPDAVTPLQGRALRALQAMPEATQRAFGDLAVVVAEEFASQPASGKR